MAFGDIGYSAMDALRPVASGNGGNGTPGKVAGATPQQAVKVLSLRIPERAAAGSIAPLPLLTGQGSAAPGASAFTSLIAQLASAMKPQVSGGPQVPTLGTPPGNFGTQPVPVSGQSPFWPVPRDPDRPREPVIPEEPHGEPPQSRVTGGFGPRIDDGRPPQPEPEPSAPRPNNPLPPVITFPGPDLPPGPPVDDTGPERPESPVYNPPDIQGLFDDSPPKAWDYIPNYKRSLFEDYGW